MKRLNTILDALLEVPVSEYPTPELAKMAAIFVLVCLQPPPGPGWPKPVPGACSFVPVVLPERPKRSQPRGAYSRRTLKGVYGG